MDEQVQCIQCDHVGVTTEGSIVKEIISEHGQHYFRAICQIGSLFGFAVEGELSAIGDTPEQALVNLEKEKREFSESIWE
jgi:hypothetical protein